MCALYKSSIHFTKTVEVNGLILFLTGLVGFTKSLAKEVASRNVRVNMVAPGFIETDMTSILRKQNSGIESLIPLGRYGTVHEVAETVCFLAEAPYITGEVCTHPSQHPQLP